MEVPFLVAERQSRGRAVSMGDRPIHTESAPPAQPEAELIRVAQQICQTHFDVHKDQAERPLGVIVHQLSRRGQLIFKKRPALMLNECYISMDEIDRFIHSPS